MKTKLRAKQYIGDASSAAFMAGNRRERIFFDEVTHVSSHGIETVIYTIHERYRTFYSIYEILCRLPAGRFFKVHKDHLVNIDYVDRIEQLEVVLGRIKVPATYYYRAQLAQALQERSKKEML